MNYCETRILLQLSFLACKYDFYRICCYNLNAINSLVYCSSRCWDPGLNATGRKETGHNATDKMQLRRKSIITLDERHNAAEIATTVIICTCFVK